MELDWPTLIAGDAQADPRHVVSFVAIAAVGFAIYFVLLLIDRGWKAWVVAAFALATVVAGSSIWALCNLDLRP